MVFHLDADTNQRREWTRKRKEIVKGFAQLNGVESLACVPMSTSESWLLADDQVWTDFGLTDLTLLPRRPEAIWGERNDPNGDHPHQYFRRVCVAAGVDDTREVRVQIAERTDLATLKKACPISFVSFVADVKSMHF